MGSIDPYTASGEEERSGKTYISLQMAKKTNRCQVSNINCLFY